MDVQLLQIFFPYLIHFYCHRNPIIYCTGKNPLPASVGLVRYLSCFFGRGIQIRAEDGLHVCMCVLVCMHVLSVHE